MAYLGNSPINRLYSAQAIVLSQGQTAVNVNYTPGLTLFFKNGVLLDPSIDYTATNGSVLTLASAATAGDVLQGVSLAQYAVADALPLSGGTLAGPVTGPASASETKAGLIALATTALAQALTDDATALTPKKLADAFGGANQSLVANGYQKYPNGLILQWGSAGVNPNNSPTVVSFPITFPGSWLGALCCPAGLVATGVSFGCAPSSNSQLTLYNSGGSSIGVKYIAFGY